MNQQKIRRLLQRRSAGMGGDFELESLLHEETQRLAAQDLILDPLRLELQRLAGSQLQAFRQDLFQAVKGVVEGDFAGAFQMIRASDGALQELHYFIASIQTLQEAKAAWSQLLGELALDSLVALPTLAIPSRLLNLSTNYLEKAQPRESHVVSRLCRRTLERLAHRDVRRPKLTSRIESLCREVGEATPFGEDCALKVADLEVDGYNELASGLADDLEVALLGWRSQSRRMRSPVASLALQLADTLSLAEHIKQSFSPYISANPDQS